MPAAAKPVCVPIDLLALYPRIALPYVISICDWNTMRRSLSVLLVLAAAMSWACHEKITVLPPPRTPDASSPEAGSGSPAELPKPSDTSPAVPKKSMPPLSRLDMGEIHFRQGNYLQAIQDYEAYLKSGPQAESRDRALYKIGLSHALTDKSDRDLPGTVMVLKQLISEFPESAYRSRAELILSLIARVEELRSDVRRRNSRINRLQEELKRLKEIDMKRRPTRPSS